MSHPTTERVIGILKLLADHSSEGLTFSEMSKNLSIPKGSMHPVVMTLRAHKFISFNENNKRYYLGEALFSLGSMYVNSKSILDRIGEVLSKLSDSIKATCYMGVLSGGDILYLLRKTASYINFQLVAQPGYKLPAYSTGLGKALLSNMSLDELHKIYPNGLISVTPNTITDFDMLYRQMQDIKATGVSTEVEESSPYVRCIGTSIKYNQRIIAAMSVAFSSSIDSEEVLLNYQQMLITARQEVEAIIASNPNGWIYS